MPQNSESVVQPCYFTKTAEFRLHKKISRVHSLRLAYQRLFGSVYTQTRERLSGNSNKNPTFCYVRGKISLCTVKLAVVVCWHNAELVLHTSGRCFPEDLWPRSHYLVHRFLNRAQCCAFLRSLSVHSLAQTEGHEKAADCVYVWRRVVLAVYFPSFIYLTDFERLQFAVGVTRSTCDSTGSV